MRSQGKPMQVARPDGHGYDSGSEPNRYREREREGEGERGSAVGMECASRVLHVTVTCYDYLDAPCGPPDNLPMPLE